MKTEMEGLILTDMTVGDSDRLVTVLTRNSGILRAFVRGAKNLKNLNFAPTQPFCYSHLSIYKGKSSYVIDEARLIRSFYNNRFDLQRLALAQYMCELAIKNIPENTYSSDLLDLMLNCLHVLTGTDKPTELIKTVFEIRFAVLSGSMPDIIYCSGCGKYDSDTMFFDYANNRLLCSDCIRDEQTVCMLSRGAVTAFRYIALAEPKKIFSFTLSDGSLRQLSDCAEKYILSISDTRFHTLDYYKQIQSFA